MVRTFLHVPFSPGILFRGKPRLIKIHLILCHHRGRYRRMVVFCPVLCLVFIVDRLAGAKYNTRHALGAVMQKNRFSILPGYISCRAHPCAYPAGNTVLRNGKTSVFLRKCFYKGFCMQRMISFPTLFLTGSFTVLRAISPAISSSSAAAFGSCLSGSGNGSYIAT